MSARTVDEILQQLRTLPDDKQQEVLRFVRELKASTLQGVPGQRILRFAGAIPKADLDAMRRAIDAGCERVDTDEW